MPKVKEYQIGSVQPSSGHPVFIDNGPGDTIASAAFGVAGALDDAGRSQLAEQRRRDAEIKQLAEEKQRREEDVLVAGLLNTASDQEQAWLNDLDQNPARQGEGAKGLHADLSDQYRRMADALVSESGLSPDKQSLVAERIYASGEQFRRHVASWESAQGQSVRMQTARKTLDLMTNDMVDFARNGGGVEDVEATIEKYRPTVMLTNPDPAKLEIALGAAFKTALYAMSDVNPAGAKEALSTDAARKYVDAAEREVMLDAFEKKRVPVEVEKLTEDISQVSGYDNQIALANQIEDKAVKDGVLKDLKARESIRLDEVERNADSFRAKFFTELDKGKTFGSLSSFGRMLAQELPGDDYADKRHALMGHYEATLDKLESDRKKAADGPAGSKELLKEEWMSWARGRIRADSITDPDVALEWAKSGLIPPEYTTDVRQEIQRNSEDPAVSQYITRARRMYPGVASNPAIQAKLGDALEVAYRESKKTGKVFSEQEMNALADNLLKNPAVWKKNSTVLDAPLESWLTGVQAKHPGAYLDYGGGIVKAVYRDENGVLLAEDVRGRIGLMPDVKLPNLKKAH